MLKPADQLARTRQLLRWINARNPAMQAKAMEHERGEPLHTASANFYREQAPKVDWALRRLVAKAKVSPSARRNVAEELLQYGSDRVSPDFAYVPVGVAFEITKTGEVRRIERLLSLPVEFGLTLAALLADKSPIQVRQCANDKCRVLIAVASGRGIGKGRQSSYCTDHTPESTKRYHAKQKPKKRNRK